jgi:hypothetical protein
MLIIASEFLACSRRHGAGDVSICVPAHVVRLMLYTLACDATSSAIDKGVVSQWSTQVASS